MTNARKLRTLLRNPTLSWQLLEASRRHRQMERAFRDACQTRVGSAMKLEFPNLDAPWNQYFQRNFFSILFLAIFRALGMTSSKVCDYGLLLHSVRGLVTATDNILDNEAKGAVQIRDMDGRVLPNVLLIMLQQGLIEQTLAKLSDDDSERSSMAGRELMASLTAIAGEEAEEEGVVSRVLSPEALLDQIHSYRGAALLDLAFVAPGCLEIGLSDRLDQARKGVRQLGLALQILDDVTDLALDLAERNHNYLRSWILCEQGDGPIDDARLHELVTRPDFTPEQVFPVATRAVLEQALLRAFDGFAQLQQVGLPISERDGRALMGELFTLRGLPHLWQFAIRDAA